MPRRWRKLLLTPLLIAAGFAGGTAAAALTASFSVQDARLSAQQSNDAAQARALAAAIRMYNGTPERECDPNPRPNDERLCVGLAEPNADATRGLIGIRLRSANGIGAAVLYVGETPQGEYGFYWAGNGLNYRQFKLPGEVLVCSGEDQLNVRSDPSSTAEIVGTLAPLTQVVVQSFVLTDAGTPPLSFGHGWYFIDEPVRGYVSSRWLSAAEHGDCSVHTAQSARNE